MNLGKNESKGVTETGVKMSNNLLWHHSGIIAGFRHYAQADFIRFTL
jgi:hypothetical protein